MTELLKPRVMELIDLTSTPDLFFEILPEDWQVEIAPYWPEYADKAIIYGLMDQEQIIAGGIVFSVVSPDIQTYREVAQQWLDKGYRYLGFLLVHEGRRKEGLGSLLIQKIRTQDPAQKFWLAIDDHDLVRFYSQLGFKVVQQVQNAGVEEWILVD